MKWMLLISVLFAGLCNKALAQLNQEKAQTDEIIELLFIGHDVSVHSANYSAMSGKTIHL